MMFGLDFIKRLKPCKWRYKPPLDDGVDHFGFVAQEVDKIVSYKEFGFVKIDSNGYYIINIAEFIGPIVKAIQELDFKVEQLKEKLK